MTNPSRAVTDCLLVGDYVDEGECPSKVASHGEAVRAQMAADNVDVWGRDEGLREFTVLLKDGQVAAVRGHSLKSEQAGVFSIVVRIDHAEEVVALFKSDDVSAIFHGELRPGRKIA